MRSRIQMDGHHALFSRWHAQCMPDELVDDKREIQGPWHQYHTQDAPQDGFGNGKTWIARIGSGLCESRNDRLDAPIQSGLPYEVEKEHSVVPCRKGNQADPFTLKVLQGYG